MSFPQVPDDFRSGFAVWSGTSFAAPWIVGEIAAEVVRHKASPTATSGPSRATVASAEVVATANAERFPTKKQKKKEKKRKKAR